MKILTTNKNADRNYEIIEKYEAGIELFGTEVKSVSKSNCSINEAYVTFIHNEAYIINMHIAPYEQGNIQNKDPYRNRKLLLHKNEILKIDFQHKKDRLTVIPIKIYWRGGKIKVEIALAKGKKLYDKREDIRRKDDKKISY